MSDKQQKQQPHLGWARASASPIRANNNPPLRLMSPAPSQPRQRSPTPTFNARQLPETSPFNPMQQSPTPPLRRPMPPTPTGFTTVYESHRSSVQSTPQHFHQNPQKYGEMMSPINLPPDVSYPRPFRNTFSPAASASTPCSIPPFSPLPEQYLYKPISDDYYVVPLEPVNLTKGVTVYDEQNENRPSTADIIAQQSQDYVDEKLAEYQATITLLQGEHLRIFKI